MWLFTIIANAQIIGGGTEYWMTVDSRIKELEYQQFPTAPVGLNQCWRNYINTPLAGAKKLYGAKFNLSIDKAENAPSPTSYIWTVARSECTPSTPPVDGWLILDGTATTQSVIGRAWRAGYYYVACWPIVPGHITYPIYGTFAVIGGPLEVLPIDNSSRSKIIGGEAIQVPRHENSITDVLSAKNSPYYLQLFSTPPLTGADSDYATNEQKPQSFKFVLRNQPEGTEHTWIVPSSLKNVLAQSPPDLTANSAWIFGNSPVTNVEVKCHAKYTISDSGGTQTLEVDDNTESDPIFTHIVNVHKPGSSVVQYSTPGRWTQGIITSITNGYGPGHGAKRHDILQILDTTGNPMSGVVVQERWTVPIAGLVVNSSSVYWKTYEAFTPSNGYYALNCPFWPDDGLGFPANPDFPMPSLPRGVFYNIFDNLGYVWPLPSQNNETTISGAHRYWAGTAAVTGSSGVPLETYQVVFTPASVLGDRGTVSHGP
jgi:hypothetical protein